MKLQIVCAFLLATLAVTFAGKVIIEREKYIVLLKEDATDEQIEEVIQLVEEHEGLQREELFIESDNTLLPMIFGEISEETADKISELGIVDVVEKDEIIHLERNIGDLDVISEISTKTSNYNLDIIDNVLCTDGTYQPPNYGKGSDIYVIDTGINYYHIDFGFLNGSSGSRAKFPGRDIVDEGLGTNLKGSDCIGHGTHCAGIAGGIYSGVAKEANIYSVRVLSCKGWGYTSWVTKGIVYVSELHTANREKPDYVGSIISLSVSGGRSTVQDRAVNASVENGVVVVTASGNSRINACDVSPGRAGKNINVGAHEYDTSNCNKKMASFSNYGPCVDIMAPGLFINSTSYRSNTAFTRMSGTSMACPHVAGLAAIVKTGDKAITAIDVKDRIKVNAIDDIDRSAMSNEVQAISKAGRMYVTHNLIA